MNKACFSFAQTWMRSIKVQRMPCAYVEMNNAVQKYSKSSNNRNEYCPVVQSKHHLHCDNLLDITYPSQYGLNDT